MLDVVARIKRWCRRLPRLWRAGPTTLAVDAAEPTQVRAASAIGHRVVFTDWVGIFTIDGAGTPYFSERTDLADRAEVEDVRLRNLVRHLAAVRYPDLTRFEPVRSADDYDCPSCRGTGQLRLPPNTRGNIICTCGGLGWLPAGYVEPTIRQDAKQSS